MGDYLYMGLSLIPCGVLSISFLSNPFVKGSAKFLLARRIQALEQETRELDVERMQNEDYQYQLQRNYSAGGGIYVRGGSNSGRGGGNSGKGGGNIGRGGGKSNVTSNFFGHKYQLKLDEEAFRDELMRYLAFGRHLEEIHVTWAHLEKKRTRLQTYTNISQEFLLRSWRRRHRLHVTPSQPISRRRHKFSRRNLSGVAFVMICIRTIDQSVGGKLRDLNAKESWALLEDLALYDNESWNDPRDFAKPFKVIALPQDVPSTSDRRLIKLENQVQRLMEAHLALTQPTQVNKVTTSCEICSGPHDTQYCMEDPEQAFVEYASSRTDEAEGKLKDSKPFDTLVDLGSCVNIIPLYLFKKLNIRLLEETNHIFGLVDGTRSYPVGIVKDVEVHIGKLKLLNDFYVIDMKKDPETLLLVGKGFLATANAVIDCRMAKIAVGDGITRSVFGVKGVDLGEEEAPYWTTLGKRESYKPRPRSERVGAQTPYYARKDFLDCHLPGEWEIARDAELNPFKDTLVFRRMVEFLGAIPINLKNMGDDVDISMLTMEQYLALIQYHIRPCVVKPEIGNDVEFEINSQFMKELRRNLFAGTDDEDAHEHVRRVLEIAYLFHTHGVTHDTKMLRVFPITLTRAAKRWEKRLTAGVINTWDLLEKAFIRQYCPPFKTTRKLEKSWIF
ncbi:MAK10-like protein [Tanacetum coccineum]